MKREMLIEKASRVLREEGIGMLFRKTRLYLKNRAFKYRSPSEKDSIKQCYRDVLFINGCYLDAPTRYRVKPVSYTHLSRNEDLKIEQLFCKRLLDLVCSMIGLVLTLSLIHI